MRSGPAIVKMALSSPHRRRSRELASDRRAGEWARTKARRAQYQFIRRNWRPVTVLAAVTVLPGVAAAALLPPPVAGFLLGVLFTSVGAAVWFLAVQATGTAPTMAGDTAEQWTAQELRRLRRKGWRLVNRVTLKHKDIDHVLIGPGGAYAIETKWTATAWRLDASDDRIRRAAVQASDNGQDLNRWHAFKSLGVSVEPVVFLWGAGLADLASEQSVWRLHGVDVVIGARAKKWRQQLDAERLSADQINGAWSALDVHSQKRDAFEPLNTPLSLFDMYKSGSVVAGSFTGGMLASAQLYQFGALSLGLFGSVLLAVAVARARRWAALRLAATAAAAGAIGVAALVIAIIGWQSLTS